MVVCQVRGWVNGASVGCAVCDVHQLSNRDEVRGGHTGSESSGKIVIRTPERAWGVKYVCVCAFSLVLVLQY